MNTSLESKISVLNDTLKQIFEKDFHLARIKFISLFISALCKVQTVSFEKLAVAFDSEVDTGSSLRRIQRFMASYIFDTALVAKLILKLLPNKPPYRLIMDRTNWKFGTKNINILMIGIAYQGVAFPILYTMMPKFGNSSSQERIDLINRFISLFGKDAIDCILADREFVGELWIGYLNAQKLRYHIRIRENFWVTIPRNGHQLKASWLFTDLKINKFKYYSKIVNINGQLCYLSGSKVMNKNGIPELQIIISFNKPQEADGLYKERWQIETMFRAMKTSGFNIEDTHLSDIERVNKLIALVIIAFAWAYIIGVYLNSIKSIRILKHGRKAYSFFKYGLNYIAKLLNNNNIDEFKLCCNFLSCT